MNLQLRELINSIQTWHLENKGRLLVSRPYSCTFTAQHCEVNLIICLNLTDQTNNLCADIRSVPDNLTMFREQFTINTNDINIRHEPELLLHLVIDWLKQKSIYITLLENTND